MIDVAWKAIFKVFLVALLFYILYLIRSVLAWMVLALIISILLNPWIHSLEKRKIPRSIGAVLVYFSLIILFGAVVYILVPPLMMEVQYFSVNFSDYFNKVPLLLNQIGINSFQDVASLNANLQGSLIKVSSNILGIISAVFGSIFGGITVFALALFMSIEEKDIVKAIKAVSPKSFEEEVLRRWQRSQDHVVAWFGSRVVCAIAVSLMTFLMCVFLKVKFSLALALLTGLLNFVPVFGPLVAGLILMLVAVLDSWSKVVLVLIFSIIIQQIESNILTPVLTKKITGLPNVLVLASILVGGTLGGVVGAILAIPFAGILFELSRDYFNRKKISD